MSLMPRNIFPAYMTGSISPQPPMPGQPQGLLAGVMQPNRQQQLYQGLLSAGGALLQAGGPSTSPVGAGQALGAGFGAFGQGMQQAKDQQRQDAMFGLQMGQFEAQQAQQAALVKAKNDYVSGAMPEIPGLPRNVVANMDLGTFAKVMQTAASQGVKVEGARQIKAATMPYDLELQQNKSDLAYKNLERSLPLRKQIAQAGASNIQVTNAGPVAGERVAAEEGVKNYTAAQEVANVAQDTLGTLDQLQEASKSFGTGQFAPVRLQVLKTLSDTVGLAPENVNQMQSGEFIDVLVKRLELQAAGAMKGQGQITESERKILRDGLMGLQTSPKAFQNVVDKIRTGAQRNIERAQALNGIASQTGFVTIGQVGAVDQALREKWSKGANQKRLKFVEGQGLVGK